MIIVNVMIGNYQLILKVRMGVNIRIRIRNRKRKRTNFIKTMKIYVKWKVYHRLGEYWLEDRFTLGV